MGRSHAASGRSILGNRRGALSIEYALLTGVVALAAMTGLAPLGRGLAQEFAQLSRSGTAVAAECRRVEWTAEEARLVVPVPRRAVGALREAP